MGKYEIMYILSANLDDAARKAEIEKLHGILTANSATIRNVNEWGVREFAYPIKKLTKGYYVILKVTAEPEGLKESSVSLSLPIKTNHPKGGSLWLTMSF